MSKWVSKKLQEKVVAIRVHEKKQIGMVLTHDKKDKLLNFRFRYRM